MRNCPEVADAGIIDLATHCRKLVHLDISHCARVCEYGDAPILKIAQCKRLRSLNLEGCGLVRGVGLEASASP